MVKVNSAEELLNFYAAGERNFENSDLTAAILPGVNLRDINLSGAILARADLSGADLSNAVLLRANMSTAMLNKADFSHANLTRADFSRAVMTKTIFVQATMLRTNLSGTILLQANLENARLREANLKDANLRGANLEGTNLVQAQYNHKTLFPEGFDPIKATKTLMPDYPIPTNVNDAEGWNYFWKYLITKGYQYDFLCHIFDDSDWLIPFLQKLEYKTVLCAGNGISLEAYILAYIGFDVTVLDVSAYANQYLANYPLSYQELNWFAYFSDNNLDNISTAEISNKVKTVKFITGSIFDSEICPGLFDVIITRSTVQLFNLMSEDKLIEAMQSLLNRLSPTGLLINHGHNAYKINEFLQNWLLNQGICASTKIDDKLENTNQKFVYLRGTSG
ncbi:pentapeptide repeat-containing protein [Anabaena azotica]|uniref:pentapeptide repeat-containing protein n=1 Tax=Anabaena azotica TaxID=197653 RepID=UPI0039A7041E